jgi:ATP-dependent helicase/nuclease subunit A
MSAPGLFGLDRNAVVAASAGTGKTQLITTIYIAHVLGLGRRGPIAPERIVATTFSRLAAQEIRERLERRLGALAEALADGNLAALDPALRERALDRGVSGRDLRDRAKEGLAELPRTLIDTLHGLSARVIRTLALEIGLGPSFTILDEQLASEDAEGVIEEVLSSAIAASPERKRAVIRLIDAAGGLDQTRSALIGFLGVLDEEGLDADALASFDASADQRALLALFSTAARALLEGGVEPELVAAARATIGALGRSPVDIDALEDAFTRIVELKAPKVARLPGGRAFGSAVDGLLKGKSKRDRLRATARFLRLAPDLAEESRAIAAIVGDVQRVLRARRKRRGALGFGDLLRIARDALRDRPDLAERSAAEIDLLLVDEFQDTSRVQRDLILLLRERPDSRAKRAPGALPAAESILPEGLVVVGDRKQSIYAFRGADVAIYAELLAELAGEPAARALDLRGVRTAREPVADFVPLTRNYRSGSAILSFVNALARLDFSDSPREAFEIRYSDAEALVPAPERDPGRVTLLIDDGAIPENADALLASAEGPLRSAFVVAGYCARMQTAGTPLAEIAILARRRSTLPMVELALDRLGIPFVVSGRALYATPEVRDLAAVLRVAQDPYNRHALAAVARSPLGGLSDRTLAELSRPESGLPRARSWQFDSVSDPEERACAQELARSLRELELTLPLLSPRDALACAVERFELEGVLGALPRGAVRFGNVGRLLEIAGRHGGSLPMFVRWLDRQIALETDESEAAIFSKDDDAVRLLTIHASKGLSFPVTIVVDVGSAEQPRAFPLSLLREGEGPPVLVIRHRNVDGNVETPLASRARKDAQARARAERQRLSYVALTRAERELVIAVPPEPRPGSLGESLTRLLTAESLSELAFERLSAGELLGIRPPARAAGSLALPPPAKPRVGRIESVAIGVTALADFGICPRRFSLLHVIGISEPERPRERSEHPGDDARALGSAAHRVLERFPVERWGTAVSSGEIARELAREGLDPEAADTLATAEGIQRFLVSAYAGLVSRGGATIHRELELGLVLPFSSGKSRGSSQLELFQSKGPLERAVVKATLDLVVEHGDGSLDVIDYKRSQGGDEERYAMQLYTYGEAARSAFGAERVRTGLVHLLSPSGEPEWLSPPSADLSGLVSDLVDHRYRDDYPKVPPERCRRARCGFFPACYPPRKTA